MGNVIISSDFNSFRYENTRLFTYEKSRLDDDQRCGADSYPADCSVAGRVDPWYFF